MAHYFLPVGLVLALLISWLEPAPGTALQQMGLAPWLVITIFLVNGYQANLKQFPRGRAVVPLAAIAIAISLLISPLLGLAIASGLGLPAAAALGLVAMATVPPTLSSGIVVTQLAGGDVVKALFLTILLNLLGIFTIPFMLHLTLGSAGLVEVSPLPLLKQLLLIVLVPFLLGMGLKSLVRIPPRHWLLKYLPSSCVITTVWISASASSETLRALDLSLFLLLVVGALAVHGTLLVLCGAAGAMRGMERGERLALLFTASQKTLPVALGVLAGMNQLVGLAMVACIIFHFLQLMLDSMIASRLAPARAPA